MEQKAKSNKEFKEHITIRVFLIIPLLCLEIYCKHFHPLWLFNLFRHIKNLPHFQVCNLRFWCKKENVLWRERTIKVIWRNSRCFQITIGGTVSVWCNFLSDLGRICRVIKQRKHRKMGNDLNNLNLFLDVESAVYLPKWQNIWRFLRLEIPKAARRSFCSNILVQWGALIKGTTNLWCQSEYFDGRFY